jgi:hypothetical protein
MSRTQRVIGIAGLWLAGLLVLIGRLATDGPAPPPGGAYVVPPDGMRVGLDVLVNDRPLPTFVYAGKTYLPVPRLGLEYALRVRNHGPRRIAALVSVDGLSVLTGRPASEADPGFLVAPRRSVLIRGWRRDWATVAAFAFEDREKSYARRVGHPEHIGVIGLVAFEELNGRPWPPPFDLKSGALRDARRAFPEVGGTGTGYGRDLDSLIYEVPFVRSSRQRTVTLSYDTEENLRRAGVPVPGPFPVPFPGESEFTPPPPGDLRR